MDEKLKKKQDEKAQEIWAGIDPSAAQCRTCVFAQEGTEYTVGAEMSYCDIYEPPDGKPTDVLWDREPCEWHLEKI